MSSPFRTAALFAGVAAMAAAGALLALVAADAVAPAGALSALRGLRVGGAVEEQAVRQAGGLSALLAPLPPAAGASATVGVRPWRVGIQVGHLRISELPDEQARLRNNTGTRWGGVAEVDVNLRIASLAARELRRAGVVVDLLPAAVPAGYEADAFVAVHADDGGGRRVSGWKVAAPRRSSEASRLLAASLAHAYGRESGLAEDRYGVTFNMRGYYAFSWTRYRGAISPWTPAAIIETGYLTSAEDRGLIVDAPGRAARGIALGILAYLAERPRLEARSLVPLAYPPMVVAASDAALRFLAGDGEKIVARLSAGTTVRPSGMSQGWVEVTVQGNFRLAGWIRSEDLVTAGG